MTPEERTRKAAQRQLDAYNAHDVDRFVDAYHPQVELYDLRTGALSGRGHDFLRDTYETLFENAPRVRASVINRSIVGDLAFDHEIVTGLGNAPIQAMAVYQVGQDGLIAKVWFARA